jgi:hypothetical protein
VAGLTHISAPNQPQTRPNGCHFLSYSPGHRRQYLVKVLWILKVMGNRLEKFAHGDG